MLDERRAALDRFNQDLADQLDPAKKAARLEGYRKSSASMLDGLAPSAAAAAACYAGEGRPPRDRFRAGPGQGCPPIVRPNWQFYDKALPANRRLLETMDKDAILSWLK